MAASDEVSELVATIERCSDVTVSPDGMTALRRLAELARNCDEPLELELEDGDMMLFIDGRSSPSFRCDDQDGREPCGCNVFRRFKNQPNRWCCNSCGATYTASE